MQNKYNINFDFNILIQSCKSSTKDLKAICNKLIEEIVNRRTK